MDTARVSGQDPAAIGGHVQAMLGRLKPEAAHLGLYDGTPAAG